MKKLLFALVASASLASLADASASVTDVVVQQQWPWSPEVLVSFKVGNLANNESVDVKLKGQVGGTTIDIPDSAVKGVKKGLTSGGYTCTFNPTNIPELSNKNVVPDFKVNVTTTLSAVDPSEPLYMIVDLTKASGEEGQITYLSRNDILSGNYGTYERKPSWIQNCSALDDCLIWTGVTENDVYKTSKLVFRRIKAGTFTMGSPAEELGRYSEVVMNKASGIETQHDVTLTKDFWIGVFEFTEAQQDYIAGETPSTAMSPLVKHSYYFMRGSDIGAKWPENADDEANVDADSLLGKLRQKTGFKVDLTTEAQWEYACRAGTTTTYYNGLNVTSETADGWNVDDIAYIVTGQYAPTTVGLKKPNAWGLYDMSGNADEFCLDYLSPYGLGTGPAVDPKGISTEEVAKHTWVTYYKAYRIVRGGDTFSVANARSARRYGYDPDKKDAGSVGFRLAITIP